MKKSTIRAIQQKVSARKAVCALYGMGSFFRGNSFNDLDLVAVLDCSRDEIVVEAERLHSAFRDMGVQLGLPIDLTILTPTEFNSAPLRDMATLVKLYDRDSV